MTATKLYKEIDKLKTLDKEVRQRFAEGRKRIENEMKDLTEDIQELQAITKDIYTGYVVGDFKKEVYEEHLQELKEKEAELSSSQKTLDDIEGLKKAEIAEKVYKPMQEKYAEINKVSRKVREESRLKILRAKAEYIGVIIEAQKTIDNSLKYDSYMESLQIEQGDKRNSYIGLIDHVNYLVANTYNGQAGADLSVDELRKILSDKDLPTRLKRELEAIEK